MYSNTPKPRCRNMQAANNNGSKIETASFTRTALNSLLPVIDFQEIVDFFYSIGYNEVLSLASVAFMRVISDSLWKIIDCELAERQKAPV